MQRNPSDLLPRRGPGRRAAGQPMWRAIAIDADVRRACPPHRPALFQSAGLASLLIKKWDEFPPVTGRTDAPLARCRGERRRLRKLASEDDGILTGAWRSLSPAVLPGELFAMPALRLCVFASPRLCVEFLCDGPPLCLLGAFVSSWLRRCDGCDRKSEIRNSKSEIAHGWLRWKIPNSEFRIPNSCRE